MQFFTEKKKYRGLINMKISSISERITSCLISGLFSCIQERCEKTKTVRFFASFFLAF